MNEWAELDRALDAMAVQGQRGSSRRRPMAGRACRAALRATRRRQESAGSPVVGRTQSDPPHPPRPRTIPGSHRSRSAAIRPNQTGPPRIPAHRFAARHGARESRTVPRALRAFSHRAFSRRSGRFALRRSRSRTFVFRAVRAGAHPGKRPFLGRASCEARMGGANGCGGASGGVGASAPRAKSRDGKPRTGRRIGRSVAARNRGRIPSGTSCRGIRKW